MPEAPYIANKISDEDKEVFKFFGEGPCFFEGCDDLRKNYKSEVEAAESHKRTDIIRDYSDQVRKILGYELKYEYVELPAGPVAEISSHLRKEGGATIISGPLTEAEKKPYKFFGTGPCPFKDCEAMREQYWKEYNALEEDPDCTDCMKSKLTARYLDKVLGKMRQEEARENR